MKYDSVIFDLDGTLLDTLEDLCDSVNFALKEFSMKERTISEVREFVGNGMENLIKRAVEENTKADLIPEILEVFKSHYARHSKDKTKPYDGITELLTALKARGIPTAVVSNKADPAVALLIPEYFPGLIDTAIGELSGIARKPAPDTVLLAMKRLSVSNPVYVGDSEVDVLTAKNAGIDGIFVTWGFRDEAVLRTAGAEAVVNTPNELLEVLL